MAHFVKYYKNNKNLSFYTLHYLYRGIKPKNKSLK